MVIVNDHLYPDGGADMVALASADALAQLGVNVTYFAADSLRPGDVTQRPYAVARTGQLDLATDPNRLRAATQGVWNSRAAHELRTLLGGFDPTRTVVHVHSWTKALSSSVFRAAGKAGFPVLCTLHDYFSVCPNGLLFNSQTSSNCLLRPMSVACVATHCDPRAYAHKLYRVARQSVQQRFGGLPGHVDEFVTISGFSERMAAQHLPIDSHFSRVRNPIDVFERPEPADPGASSTFVMVARMFAPKGWSMFLEACKLAGVNALAVGDGPDRAALEQRFRSARFVGQIDRQSVTAAVRASRALVMPSLWHETQGLVIAEAAAQGIPAIVADACGGAETVEHGVTGLLFRQGNVDSLADALRRLAGDASLARRMGLEAAQRFWADAPTPATHARELLAVYDRVLARRAAQC